MWLDGEYGCYWCDWSVSGWTFVQVNVRSSRKRFFYLLPGKRLWRKADHEVPEKMGPEELASWYLQAIREYEEYEVKCGRLPH